MAENGNFKCSGNCLGCSPAQRAYCASQHSYSNMKVLDAVMGVVIQMNEKMSVMSEKIEALQSDNNVVFDPTKPCDEEIAQSGDGADSRSPETID